MRVSHAALSNNAIRPADMLSWMMLRITQRQPARRRRNQRQATANHLSTCRRCSIFHRRFTTTRVALATHNSNALHHADNVFRHSLLFSERRR